MSNNSITSDHRPGRRHQLTMAERRLGGEHAARAAERDGRGRFASEDGSLPGDGSVSASGADPSRSAVGRDAGATRHQLTATERRLGGEHASQIVERDGHGRFAADDDDEAWDGDPSTGS